MASRGVRAKDFSVHHSSCCHPLCLLPSAALVISIRGSLSIDDFITDALAAPLDASSELGPTVAWMRSHGIPVPPDALLLVHAGIWAAAKVIRAALLRHRLLESVAGVGGLGEGVGDSVLAARQAGSTSSGGGGLASPEDITVDMGREEGLQQQGSRASETGQAKGAFPASASVPFRANGAIENGVATLLSPCDDPTAFGFRDLQVRGGGLVGGRGAGGWQQQQCQTLPSRSTLPACCTCSSSSRGTPSGPVSPPSSPSRCGWLESSVLPSSGAGARVLCTVLLALLARDLLVGAAFVLRILGL
jgi:hypothetical protein